MLRSVILGLLVAAGLSYYLYRALEKSECVISGNVYTCPARR